jgi:two-component system sensor histidine kinase UhpB
VKDSVGACLELTVRDDGFGIAADQAPGFGLRGMQERVQALGGEFAIESRGGRGTCVRIVIPLPLALPSRDPLPDHAGSSP